MAQYYYNYFCLDEKDEHLFPPILYHSFKKPNTIPTLPGYTSQQEINTLPLIGRRLLDLECLIAVCFHKYHMENQRSDSPRFLACIEAEINCEPGTVPNFDTPLITTTDDWIKRIPSPIITPGSYETFWDCSGKKFRKLINPTKVTNRPRITNPTCLRHSPNLGSYNCTCYVLDCPIHHLLCVCIYPTEPKICYCPRPCPLHHELTQRCNCERCNCPVKHSLQ